MPENREKIILQAKCSAATAVLGKNSQRLLARQFHGSMRTSSRPISIAGREEEVQCPDKRCNGQQELIDRG